ncbi:guanine nucleotide-binding protein G(o) subunit alpha [Eurytemora carolleeae]|uniref:guanine nucleotide-binding protein G(o) subunit alpha n=1 Tax=Eurytemora carolleeae TaxID=1294199 RepID=UPI000C792270|nr:guanine nucleotide-binding protein G(o) subunit alpha [Eurytemora carolleeae]|eukprot:XP_023342610.1 guanine nucleotide-binding protein G(o) subunit alpha-like [Eurytemora affinis]
MGAPESGKSTFLKHMRIIHKSDFSLEERLMFKPIVYANSIQSISLILHAVERLGIDLDSEESEYNAYVFYQLLEEQTSHSHTLVEDVKVTKDLAKVISQLWKDTGVQAAFLRSNEYNLSDCAKYFLDNVERLGQNSYIPTTEDILHCRIKTSGIVEVKFFIKDMVFRIHDVGGQKSERRKWLYLFDCVHAVVFCVSLTEYAQKSGADINKMHESIKLFNMIANSRVFFDASIVLFLNKTDLFAELCKRVPLTTAFPDYTGKRNYEESIEFVKARFKEQRKQEIFIHLLCATDMTTVRSVCNSITDMLIKNFLKDCGIY